MAANPIPEAMVDALYDELFRVGKYLHAPVPIDPKEIIRRHLAAAQQQGGRECSHEAWEENGGWCKCVDCGHGWSARTAPPSAPVGVGAPGSRAWMAEVCRAAALSLAAHGVRNDQLSKVADWIAQQPAAGAAMEFDGTDREVLREFIRICREHKPVGPWPGERVCKAIERAMDNEKPFRFIAEADMAPERAPSMKDADRMLSGPRRAAPPPAAAQRQEPTT